MPYIHITSAPGRTVDDFRSVNSKTDPPEKLDGLITWAAGSDAEGLHVVALWESRAHADRYEAEQLFPVFQEFGLNPASMSATSYDAAEFYLRS
jgi:hypothetical protein